MMKITKPNLLLVDDDRDDCLFFKEALGALPVTASLTMLHNGEQLMQLLSKKAVAPAPHRILFLDLNMPRKNGYEVLSELKLDKKLKKLPIIIFSTSSELDVANLLYEKGAHYYINKPTEFSQLKRVIYQALLLTTISSVKQPAKRNFVIKGDLGAIQL
jgi:CheY-like chemotaxis protein